MVLLLSSAFQCQDDSLKKPSDEQQQICSTSSRPDWINEAIHSIKVDGSKGAVIRYKYHGEYVFLIDACHECPDYMASVYNCEQEHICSFGGIAGINTCPDFGDAATNEKIIWKNY